MTQPSTGSASRRSTPSEPKATGLDLARRAEIGEARRMRTRSALLQAAIEVLGHEEGRFATVDDIIRKADVSRGTFYNHFEGREKFLEAVAYQLSHDFNVALDKAGGGIGDPAVRAANWTRQYLRRMRAEPHWGWAVVNVGINGRHLLGEETYTAARVNIAAARKLGTFDVPNPVAALDMGVGAVFASALTILREQTKPDHPEATAYMLLLALGVPAPTAREIVSRPLAKLPEFNL